MDPTEQYLRERLGDGLKISESLKPYTTMKVGGPADFFYVAKTIDELVPAVTAAWERNLAYFIFSGGSNVLISDYGFPGLVIKNETNNLVFLGEKSQVIADSGTPLGYFISQCTSRGLSGLEWASGIPGTVGGAVYGNMAAWKNETIKLVKAATVLVPPEWKGRSKPVRRSGFADERLGRPARLPRETWGNDVAPPRILTVKPSWFQAHYRTTKLKEMAAKGETRIPVILTVRFQMTRRRQDEVIKSLQYYQKYRSERQPVGLMTMGSTFRNPGGFSTDEAMQENRQAAGWYLDHLNNGSVKGLNVGGAKVSDKHANFLINDGTATARDVRKLIETMQDKVREHHNIELQEEIEYVGRW